MRALSHEPKVPSASPGNRRRQLPSPSLEGSVEGLKDSVPAAVGIAAYGLFFGVLAARAGLTGLDVLVMSALVFSGSAQFAGLPMLSGGAGPGELFAATWMLSLRHLVMGISLAPRMVGQPLARRLVLAFGLNDESYALTTARMARSGFAPGYMLAAGMATLASWVGSTVAGTVLAGAQALSSAAADSARWGLDFAFPAVFIALLAPQLRGRAAAAALVGAVVASAAAAPFVDTGGRVLAGALGAAVGGACSERAR